MVDATNNPTNWTRYCILFHHISALCLEFPMVIFEIESSESNKVAREVVKSVRDSGYQCYFIFRGMVGSNIIRNEVPISSLKPFL
ncbi:hypothetical protein YC2023_109245 [Brassica napus]